MENEETKQPAREVTSKFSEVNGNDIERFSDEKLLPQGGGESYYADWINDQFENNSV